MSAEAPLRRQLGLGAVAAVVVGDMLGSGIFFTPGELARVADSPWQVYFFWGLCGLITLAGALTLAELSALLPRAGASYHIIREGFGPFWAFLKIWIEMWVSGPGSVAGVAIVFGEFTARLLDPSAPGSPAAWGVAAIAFFAGVNLLGIRWGGRTQVLLTLTKTVGLLGLVGGSLFLIRSVAPAPVDSASAGGGLLSFLRLVGLGVAAVLFTYDGWVDVTHVAGEVTEPRKHLPLGLGLGVGGVTGIYLLVNYAYLRVVPLGAMRDAPTTIATRVAIAAFGPTGGSLLNGLITVSIFGALGGLVMTLPRLYYAAASQYEGETRGRSPHVFFRTLSSVSSGTGAPVGSILFCAAFSSVALLFFGSFSRVVNFFVVPLQFVNVLMVAAVFRLRARSSQDPAAYRAPGYPLLPLLYIGAIGLLLGSAILYNLVDTLIGVALTATGAPVYFWVSKRAS